MEGGIWGEVEGSDGGHGEPAEEEEESSACFSVGVDGLEESAHAGTQIVRQRAGGRLLVPVHLDSNSRQLCVLLKRQNRRESQVLVKEFAGSCLLAQDLMFEN